MMEPVPDDGYVHPAERAARRGSQPTPTPRDVPCDLDAERALLGAMLVSDRSIDEAIAVVAPSAFYHPSHQHIYAAILSLHVEKEAADIVTVGRRLEETGAPDGAKRALLEVATVRATPANVVRYAKAIREDWWLREQMAGAEEIKLAARKRDVEGVANQIRVLNEQPAADAEKGFKRYTAAELDAADLSMLWAVRGLMVHPTYGMIAGEQKSLKSYFSTFLDIAVASGTKLFDQFQVEMAGPVVCYVGEGGKVPFTRRLRRIAQSMGVGLADLDLHPTFNVAPANSEEFTYSLRRDLDELGPTLVHIDPWYAYHGTETEAQNLHKEGALLASMSSVCVEADASLLINHHFNQTGTKKGIGRLAMAGAQEWVDSWMLLGHRKDPDVPRGRFFLQLEVGSRQWGGAIWDLDLDVGRFDPDTGEFDGLISWDLRRSSSVVSQEAAQEKVIAAIAEGPPEGMRKEDLRPVTGLASGTAGHLIERMAEKCLILKVMVPIPDKNGRVRNQVRFQCVPTDDDTE